MPQFADCYFLLSNRETNYLKSIIDFFQVCNFEYDSEYYTSNLLKFDKIMDLMDYLQNNQNESHTIYWDTNDNLYNVQNLLLCYTNDKKVILGCAIPARKPDDRIVLQTYQKIIKKFDILYSCITIEEVCPYNSEDFIIFCEERFVPI